MPNQPLAGDSPQRFRGVSEPDMDNLIEQFNGWRQAWAEFAGNPHPDHSQEFAAACDAAEARFRAAVIQALNP